MIFASRLSFALRYASIHALISILVAILSAAVVFGFWYGVPYRQLLGVASIFVLILLVDVVCGPLLTLILASPAKSRRERWLDFSLIGLIQIAALAYGLHSVWVARPVALVHEVDRLVVVTANEVDTAQLPQAPEGLRRLPWWGVRHVGTRGPKDSQEFLENIERSFAGISPAMQPGWWLPWDQARNAMAARAKPLSELVERRPEDAAALQAAADKTGHAVADLRYLPLVSSKTLDWVALLDADMHMVGWAEVDGF